MKDGTVKWRFRAPIEEIDVCRILREMKKEGKNFVVIRSGDRSHGFVREGTPECKLLEQSCLPQSILDESTSVRCFVVAGKLEIMWSNDCRIGLAGDWEGDSWYYVPGRSIASATAAIRRFRQSSHLVRCEGL